MANDGSMGFCSGKPIETSPGVPKDVMPLRKDLIKTVQEMAARGATPYYGNLASNINPLMEQAANYYSTRMGYGPYKRSSPIQGGVMGDWGGKNVTGNTTTGGVQTTGSGSRAFTTGGQGGLVGGSGGGGVGKPSYVGQGATGPAPGINPQMMALLSMLLGGRQ